MVVVMVNLKKKKKKKVEMMVVLRRKKMEMVVVVDVIGVSDRRRWLEFEGGSSPVTVAGGTGGQGGGES